MIDTRIYEQFREIGRDMYVDRLISSHGGNLSIRFGDRVIIKRRGAMLGRLKPHDLIETRLDKNDNGVMLASTELIVHRAIYQATPALSVVHAHPRMTVAFSLSRDEIVPIDNEGSYLLKKIPVVSVEMASGSTPNGADHRRGAQRIQNRDAARARQLRHRSNPRRSLPMDQRPGRMLSNHLGSQTD